MTREVLEAREDATPPSDPTLEEKLEQLDRVLRSRVFQDSELLGTLLQYLVRQSTEDPETAVKEYTIALEVFGRDSEFDPRTNSIVRVQAKNLRAKLQAYYAAEGGSDPVLIEIPKGHYKAAFSYVRPKKGESPEPPAPAPEAGEAPAPAAPGAAAPRRKADPTKTLLIAATLVLSVVVVLLALSEADMRRHAQAEARPGGPAGTAVWSPFLESSASTLVILSNPPVFRFLNNSDSPVATDAAVAVPSEQARELGKVLEDKLVMRQGRDPRLVLSTSSYTGIGEAIGLHLLTDLFRTSGRELTLKQSRTVSADDLKNHNAILLGSAWVNDWADKLPVKEDFVFTVDASIQNTSPLPGEEREYKPRYDAAGEVEEDYALITVKPGITEEHRLMTLGGILSEGTQAAAEFVTRPEYVDELDRRLRQISDADGPPHYYQVLLRVGVDDGIPTTLSVVAVHQLKVTRK
jgi:hypothetical protein